MSLRTLLLSSAVTVFAATAAVAQVAAPAPAPAAGAPLIAPPAAAPAPVVAAPVPVAAPAPVAAPVVAAPAAVAVPVAPVAAAPKPAPAPVAAKPAAVPPLTREEIPELVKKTLLDNPEILIEVAQKYRDKQEVESKKQAQEALKKHRDALTKDETSPSVGDIKTADVTIVEFFDYHCGYCHQITPVMAKLAAEDKKLRIVFKEFPILSEDSVSASKAALGVNSLSKEKYFDYHQALMKAPAGKFDEKTLLDAAKKLGINAEKLKVEMNKPDIAAQLDANRKIAEDIGIRGTPALIIGDQLFPGAMSYEELKKEVDKARAMNASAPAN